MTRSLRVLAALVALVGLVALAGCSSSDTSSDAATAATTFEFSGSAATINGHDIPAQLIADQVAVFKKVPGAAQAALQVDKVVQDGTDQPTPEVVADLLSTEVAVTAIQDELAKRGVTVTDEHRQIATTQVRGSFGSLADQLPPEFLHQVVERYADFVAFDQALQPQSTDEELRKAYDANPNNYQRVCVRDIQVDTEADANSVLAELRAGADFATVAKARSKDTVSAPNGGDLGCNAKGNLPEVLEPDAWNGPVGELQGPIKADFGFHVMLVTKRGVAAFEDVKEDIRQEQLPQPFTSLGIWLQINLPKSNVVIDPRFGVWDSQTGQVLPKGTTSNGLTVTPQTGAGSSGSAPASSSAPAPTTAGPPTSAAPAPSTSAAPTTTGG